MTDDTEIELRSGRWTAVVSTHGASLRGVTCDDRPVVTEYRGAAARQGGQGDVLIPFPGRVRDGRYTWDGVARQLPLTDKDGPNAIHGFVRKADWQLASRSDAAASFRLEVAGAEGYPFALSIDVEYALHDDGLHVTTAITNRADVDAPVAMGFHPYFTLGSVVVDGDTLQLPFASVLEFENLLPTGRVLDVAEVGLDFRVPRPIGDTRFNHCFAKPARGADGRVVVRLSNADRACAVWMDAAFDHLVVYTGDALPQGLARRSIAIEPMSCGTDALNHPAWGLTRLAPGAVLRGAWGVSASA